MHIYLSLLIISFTAFAQSEIPTKRLDKHVIEKLEAHNKSIQASRKLSTQTKLEIRPYAEFEKAKYLIFNSQLHDEEIEKAKTIIAQNLPQDVTLVVLAKEKNKIKSTFQFFKKLVPKNRLKVVFYGDGKSFWSRDYMPIPLLDKNKKLHLTDAKYYFKFEPDQLVSQSFSSQLHKHKYYFEGGNLTNNSKGDCFIINNRRVKSMPDQTFQEKYGCKTILRFRHERGIGHVDETIKFVSDKIVLTDNQEYTEKIKNAGFTPILLPRPRGNYSTYINSIILQDTVFVPIYDQATDEQALQAYRDLGFKNVIGINTSNLSEQNLGSLHCFTMSYPDAKFQELKSFLKIK